MCVTATEGNSRVHDLACAKAIPFRAAFRQSLTPVFYFVLIANGSGARNDCFIATDIIFSYSLSLFDTVLLKIYHLIKWTPYPGAY